MKDKRHYNILVYHHDRKRLHNCKKLFPHYSHSMLYLTIIILFNLTLRPYHHHPHAMKLPSTESIQNIFKNVKNDDYGINAKEEIHLSSKDKRRNRKSSKQHHHDNTSKKMSKTMVQSTTKTKNGLSNSNSKKIVTGTQMTGVASTSIKNQSIFIKSHHNKKYKSKKEHSCSNVRMYGKLHQQNLLLFFPDSKYLPMVNDKNDGDHDHDEMDNRLPSIQHSSIEELSKYGRIISLYALHNSPISRPDEIKNSRKVGRNVKDISSLSSSVTSTTYFPSLHAEFVDTTAVTTKTSRRRSKTLNPLLDDQSEWVPLEGIYGVYMLPTGPHLVLITDSESTYRSPPINSHGNETNDKRQMNPSFPLLNIRKIKSMEIVQIPAMYSPSLSSASSSSSTSTRSKTSIGLSSNQYKEIDDKLRLLRHSFREHDFYYIPQPMFNVNVVNSTTESKNIINEEQYMNACIVKDMTNSLQRSFLFRYHGDSSTKSNSNGNGHDNNGISMSFLHNIDVTSAQYSMDELSFPSNWTQHNISINEEIKPITNLCLNYENTKINPFESFLFKLDYYLSSPDTACFPGDNAVSYDSNVSHLSSWWRPLVGDSSLLQKITKASIDQSVNKHILKPDLRFFWNHDCIQPFLSEFQKMSMAHHDLSYSNSPFAILLNYCIPVTSAFVGVQENILLASNTFSSSSQNVRYDHLLISRRSKYRAGTRFTMRGSDSHGDVANYVETEQICFIRTNKNDPSVHDKHTNEMQDYIQEVYTHIQVRGSIPLRWSSPADVKTYSPRFLIGTDPLAQAKALRSHILEQLHIYSLYHDGENPKQLIFVNLIDKKKDQGRLGKTFDSVLNAVLDIYEKPEILETPASGYSLSSSMLNHQLVSHVWFDFHAECKHGRWDRLGKLLNDVSPELNKQGYFCAVPTLNNNQYDSWKILSVQSGIVRTNCVDCLDRTNVVQSVFGRYILFKQFSERIGMNDVDSSNSRRRKLPLEFVTGFKSKNFLTLPWQSGEVAHRLLWANNADAISRLYAGTPALKGDFTRTGRRTKRGAIDDGMNSLQRYYLNNFLDAYRQEGMDLLLGISKFDPMTDSSNDYIDHSLKLPSEDIFNSKKKSKSVSFGLWLHGDLQKQLRSSALSIESDMPSLAMQTLNSSDYTLTKYLIDLDHRASSFMPWWTIKQKEDIEFNEMHYDVTTERGNSVSTTKEKLKYVSASGIHTLCSVIALIQAPVVTAAIILSFFFITEEMKHT